MKHCLVKMSLISCCALVATHTVAQSAAPQRNAATAAAAKAPVTAPQAQSVAANVRAAKPSVAAVATVTAAGSVIVLADGIVANAAMAQIQPPADGFVYER